LATRRSTDLDPHRIALNLLNDFNVVPGAESKRSFSTASYAHFSKHRASIPPNATPKNTPK
jgi:hypothetical protein